MDNKITTRIRQQHNDSTYPPIDGNCFTKPASSGASTLRERLSDPMDYLSNCSLTKDVTAEHGQASSITPSSLSQSIQEGQATVSGDQSKHLTLDTSDHDKQPTSGAFHAVPDDRKGLGSKTKEFSAVTTAPSGKASFQKKHDSLPEAQQTPPASPRSSSAAATDDERSSTGRSDQEWPQNSAYAKYRAAVNQLLQKGCIHKTLPAAQDTAAATRSGSKPHTREKPEEAGISDGERMPTPQVSNTSSQMLTNTAHEEDNGLKIVDRRLTRRTTVHGWLSKTTEQSGESKPLSDALGMPPLRRTSRVNGDHRTARQCKLGGQATAPDNKRPTNAPDLVLRMSNITLAQLATNRNARRHLEDAIHEAFRKLSSIEPEDYTPEDLRISLRAGSVIVEVTLCNETRTMLRQNGTLPTSTLLAEALVNAGAIARLNELFQTNIEIMAATSDDMAQSELQPIFVHIHTPQTGDRDEPGQRSPATEISPQPMVISTTPPAYQDSVPIPPGIQPLETSELKAPKHSTALSRSRPASTDTAHSPRLSPYRAYTGVAGASSPSPASRCGRQARGRAGRRFARSASQPARGANGTSSWSPTSRSRRAARYGRLSARSYSPHPVRFDDNSDIEAMFSPSPAPAYNSAADTRCASLSARAYAPLRVSTPSRNCAPSRGYSPSGAPSPAFHSSEHIFNVPPAPSCNFKLCPTTADCSGENITVFHTRRGRPRSRRKCYRTQQRIKTPYYTRYGRCTTGLACTGSNIGVVSRPSGAPTECSSSSRSTSCDESSSDASSVVDDQSLYSSSGHSPSPSPSPAENALRSEIRGRRARSRRRAPMRTTRMTTLSASPSSYPRRRGSLRSLSGSVLSLDDALKAPTTQSIQRGKTFQQGPRKRKRSPAPSPFYSPTKSFERSPSSSTRASKAFSTASTRQMLTPDPRKRLQTFSYVDDEKSCVRCGRPKTPKLRGRVSRVCDTGPWLRCDSNVGNAACASPSTLLPAKKSRSPSCKRLNGQKYPRCKSLYKKGARHRKRRRRTIFSDHSLVTSSGTDECMPRDRPKTEVCQGDGQYRFAETPLRIGTVDVFLSVPRCVYRLRKTWVPRFVRTTVRTND